jgi:hypothetical protein
VLPALEREAGRSRVSVAEATRSIAVADTTRQLRPKDPVLGHSDAHSLHTSAAAVAVQVALRMAEPTRSAAALVDARKAA